MIQQQQSRQSYKTIDNNHVVIDQPNTRISQQSQQQQVNIYF